MDINIKHNGISGLFVSASGRLDLDSAVEYGTKIKDAVEDSDEPIKELVLDFGQISFISSFGLKIVLELYKQMNAQQGVLKLKNVSEQIKNSFKMVGFNQFLIYD